MLVRSGILVFLILAFGLAGCGGSEAEISPAPAEHDRADLGLGPGVRAITTGPGDKGSPNLDASGERLAYVVDGYVVQKDLAAGTTERRTTRDFGAGAVDWTLSGGDLTIPSIKDSEDRYTLYRTSGARDLEVEPISEDVLFVDRVPGGADLLAAFADGSESTLARLTETGEIESLYTGAVSGRITGFSLSPSGDRAVVAARQEESFALFVFDLLEGTARRVAQTDSGKEILGVPQWTKHGIRYVAGESEASGETPVYDLYRLPASGRTEAKIVSDIGEDFIPANIQVSPDGEILAVLGRRSLNSPANLYLLDLASGDLWAATSNENMEIKTSPDDLSWSADGESVLLVARAVPSEIAVRQAPADNLTTDFHNVYKVSVEGSEE